MTRPKIMQDRQKVSILISGDSLDQLRHIATQEQAPLSQVVRSILLAHLRAS